MRIDRTSQQAAEAYSQRVQRPHEEVAPASEGEAKRARSVEVHISDRSLELQRTKELVQQSPDVRQERIRAIKSSIEAGTYSVPAQDIAAKLLAGGLDGDT